MTRRHRKPVPTWLIILLGFAATFAAILWASSLYDDRGEPLLDGPVVQLLIGMLGVVGTVLTLVLKTTGEVKHETRPNSGSSMRDSTNRTELTTTSIDQRTERLESAVAHLERTHRTTASDVRELREDVQQNRRETAANFSGLRKDIGRMVDVIMKKES